MLADNTTFHFSAVLDLVIHMSVLIATAHLEKLMTITEKFYTNIVVISLSPTNFLKLAFTVQPAE